MEMEYRYPGHIEEDLTALEELISFTIDQLKEEQNKALKKIILQIFNSLKNFINLL